jgi:hypothetical protein
VELQGRTPAPLKYFTLEWYHEREPDLDAPHEEVVAYFERAKDYYNRSAQALHDSLGQARPDLLPISSPYYVDDALLVSAELDSAAATLDLVLRCGNFPAGYFDLSLHYEGAEMTPEHEQVLAEISEGPQGDRIYSFDADVHEIEVIDDGRVEHRFMFHPGVWFGVRAEQVTWQRVERPDRSLPVVEPRFRRR